MEDVIEELLKEEILDETDEYVNIHNRIKVNMSAEKLPTMNSLQQAFDASSASRSAAKGTATDEQDGTNESHAPHYGETLKKSVNAQHCNCTEEIARWKGLFVDKVLECWDREKREMVATKIARGIRQYREAAMIEIDVLQQLGKHDKGGNRKATRKLRKSYPRKQSSFLALQFRFGMQNSM